MVIKVPKHSYTVYARTTKDLKLSITQKNIKSTKLILYSWVWFSTFLKNVWY